MAELKEGRKNKALVLKSNRKVALTGLVCHPELQDTPAHTVARLPFLCVSAKRSVLTAFCR
jgi:hypothetical protein